jgi:hypothetical protein
MVPVITSKFVSKNVTALFMGFSYLYNRESIRSSNVL